VAALAVEAPEGGASGAGPAAPRAGFALSFERGGAKTPDEEDEMEEGESTEEDGDEADSGGEESAEEPAPSPTSLWMGR
jgi:hypothetical protein